MAVKLSRRVDYPMLDGANIAYFPRIFDLAHRFFEEAWEPMCGVSYPVMINERKIGFPVVHVETDFITPLRYGDTIDATLAIERIGTSSCTWKIFFTINTGLCFGQAVKSPYVSTWTPLNHNLSLKISAKVCKSICWRPKHDRP
jgi:acyl-CoA thioesterase FadM